MKYALWNCYNEFNEKNSAFDDKKYLLSNGLNDWMKVLRDQLVSKMHQLDTPDMRSLGEFDGFIFVDYPDTNPETLAWIADSGKPMYLILFENPIIRPLNYVMEYHKPFKKVFTWWKDIPEDERYVRINIPHHLDKCIWQAKQDKLCTMVSCNKHSAVPGNLYGLRKEIIDYFTTYYKPDFDLYGYGWDSEPAYKGTLTDKLAAISRYKFTFAIENYYGLRGYITEKLWDCFVAGTIPIYAGDPEIKSILPPDTAIYANDYLDLSDLAVEMSTMSDDEIGKRRENMRKFLEGDEIKQYSSQAFVDTVMRNL